MGRASDTMMNQRYSGYRTPDAYGVDIPDSDYNAALSSLDSATSRLRRAGPDNRVNDQRNSGKRTPSVAVTPQWPMLSFGGIAEAVSGDLFDHEDDDIFGLDMADDDYAAVLSDLDRASSRLRQAGGGVRTRERRTQDLRAMPRSPAPQWPIVSFGGIGDEVADQLFGADSDRADRLEARSGRATSRSAALSGRMASAYQEAGENVDFSPSGQRQWLAKMKKAQALDRRSGKSAARAEALSDQADDLLDDELDLDDDEDDDDESFGYTSSPYYGFYSGTDNLTQEISSIESRVVGIVQKYASMLKIPKLLSLNKQRDQVIDGGASSNSPQATNLENQGLAILSGITQPVAGELWTLARKRDNLRRMLRGKSAEPVGTPPRLV